MAQIIERQQSLADMIGAGLGAGLGAGVQTGMQEYVKRKGTQDLLSQLGFGQQPQQGAPQAQGMPGGEMGGQGQLSAQNMSDANVKRITSDVSLMANINDRNAPFHKQLMDQRKLIDAKEAMSQKERLELKKIDVKERQFGEKFTHESWKDYQKPREDIITDKKSAESSLETIDKMKELNKKGDLVNPFMLKMFEELGIADISALLSPDSQQFQKLTNNFLQGMKALFGSQMSAQEVQQFLKGVPHLMNSPEGRAQILDDLKLMSEKGIEKYNAMRDVEKGYEGKPAPFDFLEQVEDRKAERWAKKKEAVMQARQKVAEDKQKAADAKLKPLSEKKAIEFRDRAGGDIKEAEVLARKEGYRVGKPEGSKSLGKPPEGFVFMNDRNGDPRQVKKGDAIKAQEAGYTLIQ